MKIGKWQKKIKQNPAIIQGSGILFLLDTLKPSTWRDARSCIYVAIISSANIIYYIVAKKQTKLNILYFL